MKGVRLSCSSYLTKKQMNNTNTNGERKPVFTAKHGDEYGKIMLIFLKYPNLKAYNHKWNNPNDCEDVFHDEKDCMFKFNFYIGKKCVSRMSELKKKGLVTSVKDPDSRNHLYSWNNNYQIILKDKTIEVYKIQGYKAPKSDSWVEQMTRRFWNSLWK